MLVLMAEGALAICCCCCCCCSCCCSIACCRLACIMPPMGCSGRRFFPYQTAAIKLWVSSVWLDWSNSFLAAIVLKKYYFKISNFEMQPKFGNVSLSLTQTVHPWTIHIAECNVRCLSQKLKEKLCYNQDMVMSFLVINCPSAELWQLGPTNQIVDHLDSKPS